jgi:hypothetical protein
MIPSTQLVFVWHCSSEFSFLYWCASLSFAWLALITSCVYGITHLLNYTACNRMSVIRVNNASHAKGIRMYTNMKRKVLNFNNRRTSCLEGITHLLNWHIDFGFALFKDVIQEGGRVPLTIPRRRPASLIDQPMRHDDQHNQHWPK